MRVANVVCALAEPARARGAVRALRRAGFDRAQIGVAVPRRPSDRSGPTLAEETRFAGEASLAGAFAGAVGGAMWVLLAAADMLPTCGLPVVEYLGGSLLAGTLVGSGAGGLLGTLAGLGIPPETPAGDEEPAAGPTRVAVHAEGRGAEVWTIVGRYGARHTPPPASADRTTH